MKNCSDDLAAAVAVFDQPPSAKMTGICLNSDDVQPDKLRSEEILK